MYNMMEVMQALPASEGIDWPYRRSFAPRDMMLNSTQIFTSKNFTHLTPP